MKTLAGVALALLAGCVCLAEGDRVQTSLNRLPDGHVEITIANQYLVPITAYVVVASYTPLAKGIQRRVSVRYMDSVFSSLYCPPITPKDSHTLTFGGPHPGPDKQRIDIEVKAVIFEDGSSFGDADWADRLVRARSFYYQNLNDAIENLRAARGTGISYVQLRQTFQEMKQKRLDATQDFEEKRGIGNVFENVLANLQPGGNDATQLSVDDRIDFVINRLIESRQRVMAAKPNVVSQVGR